MIGSKIKNIRELRNYTQKHMAQKLNISQSAYSKIEKDETHISKEKIKQIAEVLQVKPDDILSFDSQKYFNNVEGDKNGSLIIESENTDLIKKLYEDKIALLESVMNHQKNTIERYQNKFGEIE